MVKTRSQIKKSIQKINEQPKNVVEQQQKVINNKSVSKIAEIECVVNSEVPYTSSENARTDITNINKMECSKEKTQHVYLFFKKMFKSDEIEAMYNTRFLITFFEKLYLFASIEYDTFGEFLLPMVKHIRNVCKNRLKNIEVSMNAFYNPDSVRKFAFDDLEYIIVKSFCVSNEDDTFYKNVLLSLYKDDKIDLFRFKKLTNSMITQIL